MCTVSEVNDTELLVQFANRHKSLVELDLIKFKFTQHNANILIGQLNSLKQFQFGLIGFYDRIRLLDRLDSK